MSIQNNGIGLQKFQELRNKFEPEKQPPDSSVQLGKSSASHVVSSNGRQVGRSDAINKLAVHSRVSENLGGQLGPAIIGNGNHEPHIELTAEQELAGG